MGKKRFLGGLERPVVLTFNSRKIIDFLLQRNDKTLTSYENGKYAFAFTSLLTEATLDELERFAEIQDEDARANYSLYKC
jgi:hypothetical protein